jgi:hypothetical protein
LSEDCLFILIKLFSSIKIQTENDNHYEKSSLDPTSVTKKQSALYTAGTVLKGPIYIHKRLSQNIPLTPTSKTARN